MGGVNCIQTFLDFWIFFLYLQGPLLLAWPYVVASVFAPCKHHVPMRGITNFDTRQMALPP